MRMVNYALALFVLAAPNSLVAQEVTWRMGHFLPQKSSYMVAVETIPERISDATEGALQIDLSHSLVAGPNLPNAVRDGRLDVVSPLHPWTSGTAPTLALAELPGLFQSTEQYRAALDEFLEDEYRAVWKEQFNGVFLASGMFDRPVIISNKPLRTAADFEGIRIRVPSLVTAQLMESLGAKPVELAFAELAPAMERGVVDAVLTDAGTSLGMGFYDVAEYVNLWNIAVFSWPIVANADSWESLPEHLKESVAAEFRSIQEDHFAGYEAHNASVIAELEENGMTIIEPTEDAVDAVFSQDHLKPLYERYLELSRDRGRPADDLLESAQAIVQR